MRLWFLTQGTAWTTLAPNDQVKIIKKWREAMNPIVLRTPFRAARVHLGDGITHGNKIFEEEDGTRLTTWKKKKGSTINGRKKYKFESVPLLETVYRDDPIRLTVETVPQQRIILVWM